MYNTSMNEMGSTFNTEERLKKDFLSFRFAFQEIVYMRADTYLTHVRKTDEGV